MKILLLDIEGVMTEGMIGESCVALMQTFHMEADTKYSRRATSLVRDLVENQGFRLVMITRHREGEEAVLNHRMAMSGIRQEWLYEADPFAIPYKGMTKGEAVAAWLARNPAFKVEDTVAVEDEAEQLRPQYPADRIVSPNPAQGFRQPDHGKVLEISGLEKKAPRRVLQATGRPAVPAA